MTQPTSLRSRLDDCDDEKEEKSEKSDGALLKRLLDHRTILLCGPVNDDMAKAALAQLLVLDAAEGDEPIKVFINSPGGAVDSGYAIYDAMRFVRCPVYTICAGLAASAATVILLGAEKGHRYTLPNTRFLLHQPSMGLQGTSSDVVIGAKEILKLRAQLYQLLADETGQTLERITDDTQRDYWMTAPEAVEYGLVNKVIDNMSALAG